MHGSLDQALHAHASGSASSLLVSRRGFLYGAAGIAACAMGAAAIGMAGCSGGAEEGASLEIVDSKVVGFEDVEPISVSAESVFTADDCEIIEDLDGTVRMAKQVSLPYGTMLWASDDAVAACLIPGETSDPLAQVGLLSLDDGKCTVVLDSAVGASEGFQIYDARADSSGIVWTEADILTGTWRVYSAKTSGASSISGDPVLLEENADGWMAPSLVASGEHAFWQTAPKSPASSEGAVGRIMRAPFGASADDAVVVLEAHGLSSCPMSPTASGIAASLAADDTGSSYGIVAIDGSDGTISDQMLLPSPMRPTYAAFGPTGFGFAFENIYEDDGGIANLGTYATVASDPQGQWFHFARTPFESPAWSNGWLLVKSTGVVAGIDMASKRYFTIEPENITQGYGEFLASESDAARFVTYSTIDYTPLNKDHIYECNVRIWEPASI